MRWSLCSLWDAYGLHLADVCVSFCECSHSARACPLATRRGSSIGIGSGLEVGLPGWAFAVFDSGTAGMLGLGAFRDGGE